MADINTKLQEVVSAAVRDALAVGVVKVAALPVMYKFPEDISSILGGHVPVGTIRSWKTSGYLRTVKVGARSYVMPEDWQWFLDNHAYLMAKNPRPRFSASGQLAS